MDLQGSVTGWIVQLKEGRRQAVQPLWERYFSRLMTLARRKLQTTQRAVADEEDVALSAFDSFFRAAEQGRFPQLDDRDDLWRLLAVIAERKALNLARDQRRHKRGGGRVVTESSFDLPAADGRAFDVPDREPSPALAALMADECRRLLESLGDQGLQTLALLKMEGRTNAEIARQQGWALRTVERKLRLIRDTWEEEAAA